MVALGLMMGCTGGLLNAEPPTKPTAVNSVNPSAILEPEAEDIPYFQVIAEDQEKRLGSCQNEAECRPIHFLRGLAALYENPELAAFHFRKVVVSKPNGTLARESQFWLWFLDVLNSPSEGNPFSPDIIKRLVREMVEKELFIHELNGQLENSSVEALKQEIVLRDKTIDQLNAKVGTLTKQTEQLQTVQTQRQDIQQELKSSQKKVEELMSQLEALRRIDQEIRDKAPPTRPSEKMTPTPELDSVSENILVPNGNEKP